MRGREVEDGRKEEEMSTPITLPTLNESILAELRRHYEETTDGETRTRYQMLLLSLQGALLLKGTGYDDLSVLQSSCTWPYEPYLASRH